MRTEREIHREAQRLVVRHETRARLLAEENRLRRERSTVKPADLALERPGRWDLDPGFNPYLVRSRSDRIGHSVRGALRTRAYRPRHPLKYLVEKPGGGTREVFVYQVADSAVSKMMFEGILKKNLPLFNSRAYAYRKDISAQDAIQYVKSELAGRTRIYIAEYDFQSYFDTIDHDFVMRVLRDNFLLTEVELAAIQGFLRTGGSEANSYRPYGEANRERGIPQGTSISLLLANVAAWDLDRSLEGVGVNFVRYADDTLIWGKDYGQVCEAVDRLHEHAAAMGVEVNLAKSPGIRLLVPEGAQGEIRSTNSLEYLGYELSLDEVRIKPASIGKIRRRISEILYHTLIYEPLRGTQDLTRLSPAVDRDYVSAIWKIRRYLYGDLSERAVRRYQFRDAPLRRFKGVMSAYPLIDDSRGLVDLDSWILTQVWLALRRRSRLLTSSGVASLPEPHGRSREELAPLWVTSYGSGNRIDLRVPSARRIAGTIRRAAARHGPSAVGRINPYGY